MIFKKNFVLIVLLGLSLSANAGVGPCDPSNPASGKFLADHQKVAQERINQEVVLGSNVAAPFTDELNKVSNEAADPAGCLAGSIPSFNFSMGWPSINDIFDSASKQACEIARQEAQKATAGLMDQASITLPPLTIAGHTIPVKPVTVGVSSYGGTGTASANINGATVSADYSGAVNATVNTMATGQKKVDQVVNAPQNYANTQVDAIKKSATDMLKNAFGGK